MKKRENQNIEITSMLQAVDFISTEAKKGSTLDETFVDKMQAAENYIAKKLEKTNRQAMVMALAIDHAFDGNINLTVIFGKTKCPTSRKLELMNDIDWLVSNHYLGNHQHRYGESTYTIPVDVLKAFRSNIEFRPKGYSKISIKELFFVLEDLFNARDDSDMSYEQLLGEVTNLFDANKDLEFVRKVRGYNLDKDEEMLLILFCHLFVNDADDDVDWDDIEFLYDRKGMSRSIKALLSDGAHILFLLKLIEYTYSDGFANRESYKLTEQAKRNLLGELKLKSVVNGRSCGNVIRSKDIRHKELFFPYAVGSQVEELKDLLLESHYKKICQRMKKRGFHSGFTCLFYGTPGTGKTETVYQLAKLTGRDVMLVDIPQVRSMWVGESEKNVKGIFVRYANLVRESRRTPILLFNEADAIIGKRTQNHDSAADKMENTMQNIILQEMENLNGILIATTNLQSNMDKAFERRFLYKIQFDRPDAVSRAKIWNTMLPELHEDVIKVLSAKFDFSGGQIENIARHYTIESILKGEKVITLQTLNSFCEQEMIKKDVKKIGF